MDVLLKPLKRFGQNFLIDKNIIRKIMDSVNVTQEDCILEIGPGGGALTFDLSQKAKKVVAVELDRGLCATLRQQSRPVKNIEVICEDILKFDLKSFSKKRKIRTFKVVANLPYYITTPIIEYLFKNIRHIEDIYIMVQKEVAERMTSGPGKKTYGSFTCFVNYFCEPKILFYIKSGSFWPAPKVGSCFVRLKPYRPKDRPYRIKSETLFFKVMRSGFGQRRKKLSSSLSKIFDKQMLIRLPEQKLLSMRPEELSLEDFARLSNAIYNAGPCSVAEF